MKLQSLGYYIGAAAEAVQNDRERDNTYQKIHEAATSYFQNPPELKALPWIKERKFVSTAPADALNAAIRTFASRLPEIQIQPLSQAPEEYDRTEKLENAMTWEFRRMNNVGSRSPHWRIVEYAMKYCAVAVETTYLPWLYQGKEDDPRVKEILRSRNFKWTVHDPSNIHVRESDEVLEMVVNHTIKSGQELIELFGADNPGVAKAIKGMENDYAKLMTTKFTLFDYTDWGARVKWIVPNTGGTVVNTNSKSGYEVMRKKRTVSFLPWVWVDNKEPLLKQMIDAGLWENVNILRTMQFSKAVDMAAHPEYWIQTPDGTLRNVEIANDNPNQPLVTGPGTSVHKLQPPSIDPGLATLLGTAESEVFRTTVAQILASVEKYAGTQNFSVVNAMLNAAVAQLSLAQMVAERAETEALFQNFRWIHETEIPMSAWRAEHKGEKRPKGEQLSIRKGEFDPDYLYVKVGLSPTSMMDKQTAVNTAINKVERLGMSMAMAWDELGLENYELSESQKTEEQLYQAHVQSEAQKIIEKGKLQAQMEAQAMQAQMAQAQQAAAQGQGGGPQPNPGPGGPEASFSGAEGLAPSPGLATRPGLGREQLNGQSMSGEDLA